jgi:FMN-dependent NADH-azoreductase
LKVLHIVATPRTNGSNTLAVADAYLDALRSRNGDVGVKTIELFSHDLPGVDGENIENKYLLMGGAILQDEQAAAWQDIEALIGDFLAADLYVISAPMWNFSIPYVLKYYIDAIVQPGYTFRYDEQGQAIGLVQGKKMVCITSRGADYSPDTPYHSYDFQEPYLRAIFGFIGVTDIEFIHAQPMDITAELREQALSEAMEHARTLAGSAAEAADSAEPSSPAPADLKPKPLVD